jgi:hypothetical protein
MTPERGEHHLLLCWMICAGLIAFALFVSWQQGWLAMLYEVDRSRLSWVISLLFIAVTVHAARRVLFISRQLAAAVQVSAALTAEAPLDLRADKGRVFLDADRSLPDCLLTSFLHDAIVQAASGTAANGGAAVAHSELTDLYRGRLRSPNELGWFASDIMIKLGLLGTIVGFVLMLGSVWSVTEFDASTMQGVLKSMSYGMGTALYTTFVGLICSMLTGAQYYLLDQGADELLETARSLVQTRVLPALARQQAPVHA